MKIALVGYGKMGKMIEKMAIEQGHEIVARVNSATWDLTALQKSDICMEFSHPESVIDNIQKIAQLKKNVIIGTTGWSHQWELVKTLVETKGIGALYSANFSLGVNLFFEILRRTSQLIGKFPEYDVSGIEMHHHKKQDVPSGTALEIEKILLNNMQSIDQVSFSSVRCGSIPGTHSVLFDSFCDTITLTHEARNRAGFAQGAIQAAQWLIGKKGLYTFPDYIREIMPRF